MSYDEQRISDLIDGGLQRKKEQEILEGNKLIADFMGWIHHEDKAYDEKEMRELKHHSSWDWLMPVVEKITDNKVDFILHVEWSDVAKCQYSWFEPCDEPAAAGAEINKGWPLIKLVFIRVVEYIKYFNSQQ